MIFDWLNVTSPFFWCFVGSIFLGGAISRISRRTLGRERWTIVYLYLTVAIAAAAVGVFVPGPSNFLDVRLAYFSAVFAALGFVCFRYAVAVGAPLLLLCAVALAVLGISLRGWLPLHGQEQSIGSVRVFDAGSSRIDLEVGAAGDSGRGNVAGSLPRGAIAPVVEVLRFSRSYFFFSSPVIYRLEGVTSAPSSGASHELPLPGSAAGQPIVASRLPGVQHKRIVGRATEARTLQDYSIILDGSLTAHLVDAPS